MKTRLLIILLLFFALQNIYIQTVKNVLLKTVTSNLEGTLMTPASDLSKTVAHIHNQLNKKHLG